MDDTTKIEAADEQEALDALIDERTEAFKVIFDKAEEADIDFDSKEWSQISVFATSEIGIKQKVSNLADLKVEDLSNYEFNRILARARTGIKRIIESRQQYAGIYQKDAAGEYVKDENGERIRIGTYGPYFENRKARRMLLKKIFKSQRASSREMSASKMIDRLKSKRVIFQKPEPQGM